VLLLVAAGSRTPLCFGVQYGEIPIRESGANYWMTLTLPDSEAVYYANGANCGVSAHRTANGPRYFAQYHLSYSLPHSGKDRNNVSRDVTVAKIDAFWDWYYTNQGYDYTRTDATDQHKWNCYTYAFGYTSTWVNNDSYILYDDYILDALPDGTVYITTGHASLVDFVLYYEDDPYRPYASSTREKNGESKIYDATWTYEHRPPFEYIFKKS
jgi:hypothetical protein